MAFSIFWYNKFDKMVSSGWPWLDFGKIWCPWGGPWELQNWGFVDAKCDFANCDQIFTFCEIAFRFYETPILEFWMKCDTTNNGLSSRGKCDFWKCHYFVHFHVHDMRFLKIKIPEFWCCQGFLKFGEVHLELGRLGIL